MNAMTWLRKDVLFFRGNRAAAAADYTRSKELFKRALVLAPADAGVYLRLAAVEQELGGESAASELLEKAAELEPRNPAIPVLRAVAYTLQERFAEALPLLASALERDSTQPLARACQGLALLRSGESEAGRKLLGEEIGNTSERFQVAVLSYTEQMILEKAGAAKLVESMLILGAEERAKEASGPAGWVNRLWTRRKTDLSERQKGERLLEERRYAEAIDPLTAALARSPDDEVGLLLGYAYLLDGKLKKAVSHVKQLEEKNGPSSSFARLGALAQLLSGRVEEAAKTLSDICRESTDFLDHHFSAVASLSRNEPQKARAALWRALRFAPEGWAAQRVAAFAELAVKKG